MSGSLLQIKATPRGAISKAEAIDYVGGPDFFAELEEQHGLCPCRELSTRKLYRVAELERCMTAAQEIIRAQRATRGE